MTTSSPEDDDRLLEELRAALRAAGPPTPSMSAAAAAAFAWRTVAAEPAELQCEAPSRDPDDDSCGDDSTLGWAAGAGPAVLRFVAGSVTVELEQGEDVWVGMLFPSAPGEVTVLTPDGSVVETAAIDEMGAFLIAPTVSGPVRLRCRTGASDVLTDWCVLRRPE